MYNKKEFMIIYYCNSIKMCTVLQLTHFLQCQAKYIEYVHTDVYMCDLVARKSYFQTSLGTKLVPISPTDIERDVRGTTIP